MPTGAARFRTAQAGQLENNDLVAATLSVPLLGFSVICCLWVPTSRYMRCALRGTPGAKGRMCRAGQERLRGRVWRLLLLRVTSRLKDPNTLVAPVPPLRSIASSHVVSASSHWINYQAYRSCPVGTLRSYRSPTSTVQDAADGTAGIRTWVEVIVG